jgi:hypothetical protein
LNVFAASAMAAFAFLEKLQDPQENFKRPFRH